VVMSYELENRIPWFFKSRNSSCPNHDFLLRDIARATSAAPTYFPPARIKSRASKSRPVGTFIDGGIYANNPAVCGFVEASEIEELRELPKLVVSLGTGEPKAAIATPALGWGIVDWLNPRKQAPLLNAMFDGMSKTADHQLEDLCRWSPQSHQRFRFDPELGQVSVAIDDPSTLPALKELTCAFISNSDHDRQLRDCCDLLKDQG